MASRSTLKPVLSIIPKLGALWIALSALPLTGRTLLGARTCYDLTFAAFLAAASTNVFNSGLGLPSYPVARIQVSMSCNFG